ncbi:hypothetical protein NEHOM01_1485 [Nematocida homosporus]|uniref:uncharacterized protein n=1 Tax=Nematocida homosporus TaxID=1912981 RepID=UPI002220AAD1|nr:uncharacterized protein NEHOM01_1485 [Nematocida homosporus]KAI5186452.1 hypothetical protein NEHOM01_1485 [Nematocida homosporus]
MAVGGGDGVSERCKEAYVRIKMAMPVERPKERVLEFQNQTTVERLDKVIGLLGMIEEGRILLKRSGSLLESRDHLLGLEKIVKKLAKYAESDVIKELVGKAEKKIDKIERLLDAGARKRLERSLVGPKEGWREYLVHPKKKGVLFVEVVQEYIEKRAVPLALEEEWTGECLVHQIDSLAEEGYPHKEKHAIMDVVHGIIDKEIKKQVTTKCYQITKSMDDPHLRVIAMIKLGNFYQINHRYLTGSQTPEDNIMEILKRHTKILFSEAESHYAAAAPNERTMQDESLVDMLAIIQAIDAHPRTFEKWSKKRQPILKALRMIAQEKSKLFSKLKGLILLDNSNHLLKKAGATDIVPEQELLTQILTQLRALLLKSVESPKKEGNRIVFLLRCVETFSAVAESYILPNKHRKTVIAEFKKEVREIAKKYGDLDEISDRHLTELISRLFSGKPIQSPSEVPAAASGN